VTRYKAIVEYLGTNLLGWQSQSDGPSVQGLIEDAIFKFRTRKIPVYGAGRTDAGVHALGQVCHFDLENEIDPFIVQSAINYFLKPHRICLVRCEIAPDDFHARFSAIERHYLYKINNRPVPTVIDRDMVWAVRRPLHLDAMKKSAQHLIGTHDFSSFRASSCQSKSPIKTINTIEIERHMNEIHIYVSARSFLHHMVRNIVGTLVEIGIGKRTPSDIKDILNAKSRVASGQTAPAQGLYFLRVDY
jgi:tRNA pseudouridine38-40 synthase